MRQETKDLSPTVGFPNYSQEREPVRLQKTPLVVEMELSRDTHVARVHRTDRQKREGIIKV